MPSKTGKPPATYYKSDVSVEQTTNVGFDSTTRRLISGDGASSAASLSDDVLSVQPVNDDTTGALLVKNNAGNNILAVDTTNSKVLMGASQVAANTQYAHFGVSSLQSLAASTGTHYVVPFGHTAIGVGNITLGTGTDPATTYDVSANNTGDDLTIMLWYIIDNITVDAVHWLAGGDAASGDTINVHLMSYDIDASGSGSGDLSNGIVVAGGADIASLGYEDIIYQTIAPSTADVDAGKVCLFTFESAGTNSNYSINATIKYHIR